jgi:hypothetical protein
MMQRLERVLVALDSGWSSAVSRIVLGLCIPPLFRALTGDRASIWKDLLLFLGLRVLPAVLRMVLPFSAEAKKIWIDRRQIAKLHDSYQWQKLLWVGLGLLLFTVVGGGLQAGEWILALFCLIGGGAGMLIWRKIDVVPPVPQLETPAFSQSKA